MTTTEKITPREREVLLWLARGKSAEEVAVILDISVPTVMFHQRAAAERFGTVNRTHTVSVALALGVIRAEDVVEGLRCSDGDDPKP